MTYESVDALQRTLADSVFQYASDRKKAAGRALGTLVEMVTFYTLCAWGFRDHVVIERKVPEFANPDILHNVEFSLHPIRTRELVEIEPLSLPLTAAKAKRHVVSARERVVRSTEILTRSKIKRNACIIVSDESGLVVANVDHFDDARCVIAVCELMNNPFAIFECKRVGVEEGMRKGPQTIEKAKQGAYVARTVSALQKIRLRNGQFQGLMERSDGTFITGNYTDLLRNVIDQSTPSDMRGFVLTVGVVSNHGNWFTSDNPNKEMRVLAQSYDWLLFLTDLGLSQFIDRLLLNPTPELDAARIAFQRSYSGERGRNRFTKVRVDVDADEALRRYFSNHEEEVESWFNVIAPRGANLDELQDDLRKLTTKNWRETQTGD